MPVVLLDAISRAFWPLRPLSVSVMRHTSVAKHQVKLGSLTTPNLYATTCSTVNHRGQSTSVAAEASRSDPYTLKTWVKASQTRSDTMAEPMAAWCGQTAV